MRLTRPVVSFVRNFPVIPAAEKPMKEPDACRDGRFGRCLQSGISSRLFAPHAKPGRRTWTDRICKRRRIHADSRGAWFADWGFDGHRDWSVAPARDRRQRGTAQRLAAV